MTQGRFERNLTQLGLVLAVRKVNGRTAFSRTLSDPGIFERTELHCTATMGHGVDSDILAALTSLYVELGMPADGTVVTSARQLLLAGLSDGGEHYRTLHTALLRMQHANDSVMDTWLDRRMHRRVSKTFNLLASVVTVDRDEDLENLRAIRAGTLLQIQFPKPIVESIASGYIRSFDMQFYQELRSVVGRGLYRILDEMRNLDEGQELLSITLPLLAWANFLGYEDVNLSSIKDNLRQSHTELINRGFLKSVTYEGRGKKAEVTYEFNPGLRPAPPADVVAMLTARGLWLARAQQLATEHGRGRIEDAVRRFEAAISRGTVQRNPPGVLPDIIKAPERYPLPDEAVLAVRPPVQPRPPVAEPVPEVQPTLQAARFTLKNVRVADLLKLEVEDLFVAGLVSAVEVAGLKQVADPARTITLWGARRGQNPGAGDGT